MDVEEVALVSFMRSKMLQKKRKKKEFWVHPYVADRFISGVYVTLYDDLRKYPKKFFNYVRMSVASFDELLNLCKFDLTKQDTILRKSITPEEKLFVTLSRRLKRSQLLQTSVPSYDEYADKNEVRLNDITSAPVENVDSPALIIEEVKLYQDANEKNPFTTDRSNNNSTSEIEKENENNDSYSTTLYKVEEGVISKTDKNEVILNNITNAAIEKVNSTTSFVEEVKLYQATNENTTLYTTDRLNYSSTPGIEQKNEKDYNSNTTLDKLGGKSISTPFVEEVKLYQATNENTTLYTTDRLNYSSTTEIGEKNEKDYSSNTTLDKLGEGNISKVQMSGGGEQGDTTGTSIITMTSKIEVNSIESLIGVEQPRFSAEISSCAKAKSKAKNKTANCGNIESPCPSEALDVDASWESNQTLTNSGEPFVVEKKFRVNEANQDFNAEEILKRYEEIVNNDTESQFKFCKNGQCKDCNNVTIMNATERAICITFHNFREDFEDIRSMERMLQNTTKSSLDKGYEVIEKVCFKIQDEPFKLVMQEAEDGECKQRNQEIVRNNKRKKKKKKKKKYGRRKFWSKNKSR